MRKGMQRRSQDEIFASYNWWDQDNLLFRITRERCDYIESCIDRAFGREALRQQTILEVGCGGGLICEQLARRGASCIGLDPSAGALEVARAHVRQSGLAGRVFFQQGVAESLPYAAGSFSVVVCLDVLEHVSDLERTINEIARVLAPGGVFVFDTINRTWLSRLVLIWIGERLFHRFGLVPGLHSYERFIKPGELRHGLQEAGFQVAEMVGFMPRLIQRRLTIAPGGPLLISYVGYAIRN